MPYSTHLQAVCVLMHIPNSIFEVKSGFTFPLSGAKMEKTKYNQKNPCIQPWDINAPIHSSIDYFLYSPSGVTGGGAGGAECPPRLLTGKFLLTYREKRGKEKKGKGWKLSRKGGKLEMEAGKRQKKRWGPFFFFLLFTFENDKNLFWVYQNGNLLPGKSISRREKNQEKWLRPLRKICLLRPCIHLYLTKKKSLYTSLKPVLKC